MSGLSATASQAAHGLAQRSDVQENGQLSPALQDWLIQEDLLDLTALMQCLGVRTLRVLFSLDSKQLACLFGKARDMYELLGIVPSQLNLVYVKLSERNLDHGRPLQPGSVRAESLVPSGFPTWVSPDWATGRSSSSSSSSSMQRPGPCLVGLGPVSTVAAELPPLKESDTQLTKDVYNTLAEVKDTLGLDRYNRAVNCLKIAHQLAVGSCLQVTEALTTLAMRKYPASQKEPLKAAKKSVRDMLIWLSCGSVIGMDSREAISDFFKFLGCDAQLQSQLINGYERTKTNLAGGFTAPRQQRHAAARTRSLSRVPGHPCRQEPGSSGDVSFQELSYSVAAPTPVAAQAMAQREIIDRNLFHGMSRPPPGLELPLPPQNPVDVLATDHVISSHVSNKLSDAIEPAQFKMPPAQGQLAVVLVRALLKELDSSEPEFSGHCAVWLAQVLEGGVGREDPEVMREVQVALTTAVYRKGIEDKSLRQVLRALAQITVLDLPFIPNLVESSDVGAADGLEIAGQEMQSDHRKSQEALVPMLAETWSWVLLDGPANISSCKLSAARKTELVDFTKSLVRRCQDKAKPLVAKHSCTAFGQLVCMFNDDLSIMVSIGQWLLQNIIDFAGYEDIMQLGSSVLLDICKERQELFGIDISPERMGDDHQTFAQDMKDSVMGLVRTCHAKRPSKVTMQTLVRLLVRTHSLEHVVQYICECTELLLGDMLCCILNEIALSLGPAVSDWSEQCKIVRSRARSQPTRRLPGDDCKLSDWASAALQKVCNNMSVGKDALKTLAPDWQTLDPGLLANWASVGKQKELQGRFFLVGFLFDVNDLLSNLAYLDHNGDHFESACRALLDLNCIKPFEQSLRLAVASCILRIRAPSMMQSCVAWLSVIGMSTRGWAKSEDPTEQNVGRKASKTVMALLQHPADKWCCPWEATWALSCIFEGSSKTAMDSTLAQEVRELMLALKAGVQKDVEVSQHADLLMSHLL